MIRSAAIAVAIGVIASQALAQTAYPPVDTSNLATTDQLQAVQTTASNAATAAAGAVRSVNGAAPAADGSVALAIPTASTIMPPCIGDIGSAGTAGTLQFAPYNHTHCSKVRRGRVLSSAAGTLAVSFSPAFAGTPICTVTAETTLGDTNVVNAQIDGPVTNTTMNARITRTAVTAVSLLGLNILAVPTSTATYVHWICIEP